MADVVIGVEVVYASVDRQLLLSVDVPAGSTVCEALLVSGIGAAFPELDLQHCAVGIFGKTVSNPDTRRLEQGERIEIYRPLLLDPMEARRLRAAKAAALAKKNQGAV
jgi:putative ubiquitin-RnfH superfamily antitoxin RatB of RatAB toxin-antitoxin module